MLMLFSASQLLGQLSAAEEVVRNETVADRTRPELDALGVRLGAFTLFPEVAGGITRDSNIYADDVDSISDSILQVSPGVAINSDWGRHKLNLGVDADIFRYSDYDTEDHVDYSAWGEGRLDVSRARFFVGAVSHARLHEDRDSPDDARGFEPTKFYRNTASISYETPRAPRQLHTRLTGEYRKLEFEDSLAANGLVNNDDRDRQRLRGTARFGYGLDSEYSLFLQGSAHSVEYDDQFDDGGFERSSTGYEFALGTTFDFSGKTFGDVFVGYLSETYDDPRFDEIDGLSFGAKIFWNISGLTTVNFSARREVEPTTIGETGGTNVKRFGVGVDHELLRNLILSLALNATQVEFKGIERQDDIRSANFAARYIMNRRLELTLGYSYRQRESEPTPNSGIEFTRNLVRLTIEGHL
jgi:hypothetical protein